MTAIPHDGVSARGLRSSVVRPRTGARLVRPGVRQKSSARGSGQAESVAMSGSAGVISAPTGIAGIPSLLGLRHLQFVLAGRRVRMGDGAFVISVLAALTAMLGALLFLNTALAETSFQLTSIREDMKELTVREQMLSSELAAAESPIGLEAKARELGMISAGSPVFLRLSDGRVLGESTPAVQSDALTLPPSDPPPVGGESVVGFSSGEAAAAGAASGGSSGGESSATQGSTGTGSTSSQSGSSATNSEQPLGMVSGANH